MNKYWREDKIKKEKRMSKMYQQLLNKPRHYINKALYEMFDYLSDEINNNEILNDSLDDLFNIKENVDIDKKFLRLYQLHVFINSFNYQKDKYWQKKVLNSAFKLIRSEEYKKDILKNMDMVIEECLDKNLYWATDEDNNYDIIFETIYQTSIILENAILLALNRDDLIIKEN